MTIAEYAKLSTDEQTGLLKKSGIFIDSYTENKALVMIYWIYGFYVELTHTSTVIEIIPYKRGYRMTDLETEPQPACSLEVACA
ncbi:MAG TPA: hypothetical protein VD905_20630 [Flavobacteriales bacterium]|nr:hypothetical protein [Flavobacteriales bacterium]